MAVHDELDQYPVSKHVIFFLSGSYPSLHITIATAPNVVSSSSLYFPFSITDTFPQSEKRRQQQQKVVK
jgi:hypothetical protein